MKQSKKMSRRINYFWRYVLLTLVGIVLIMPLIWLVSTSLKSMEEIVSYPPSILPKDIRWENYPLTIKAFPFIKYTLNTLFITFFVVVGNVLSNSYIAYGFAKLRFPGKRFFFLLVLTTMMVPGFVTMIPQYVLFSKIGWVGTYLPLIVPPFFGSAFNIFLIRQYYMAIDNELIEAAQIDGANHFYIWRRLMIPLGKPVLITVALNAFNGAWNDFLGPLLYIHDENRYTIQIGLQSFQNQSTTQWNYLMVGATLVLLPTLILFMLAQNYFIEGIDLTGGKKG